MIVASCIGFSPSCVILVSPFFFITVMLSKMKLKLITTAISRYMTSVLEEKVSFETFYRFG